MDGSGDPLDVLVVGWYPAIDDLSAGRFIADQVSALRDTGRVRPAVAAFEAIPVFGDERLRTRSAEAIERAIEPAAATWPTAFAPRGSFAPAGIPVARLAMVAGTTRTTGPEHEAEHRARALSRLVQRRDLPRPRLVHAHVGYPEGAAASTAAMALGVPLVVTEHATYLAKFFADPALRAAYLRTLDRAARVVTVSRMLAGELLAEYAAERPALGERIVVIPNTVAVEAFRPAAPADRREDELLWVGYRRRVKGIDTLLRAFRTVREQRPGATLRLVGRSVTDEEEAGWRRLAVELGVADAVRFEPPADRAGVAAAMERAALFVHPSTRETFGVVAVEALAAGLPVVACDSGGVAEVLGEDPGAFGALVPAGDPEALAGAVLATLERRHTFDPEHLHAWAASRYGAAAVGARIADLYQEVLVPSAAASDPSVGGRPSGDRPGSGPVSSPEPPADDRPFLEDLGVVAERFILVGFLRGQLDRTLAALPPDLVAELDVVTVPPAPPGVGRCTLAPAGAERRLTELVRWGAPRPRRGGLVGRLRAIAGRLKRSGPPGRRARLERRVMAELRATIVAALDAPGASERPDRPVLLVALSGIDHLVAAPLIAEGRLRAAPGGLRWLGDRWWSDRPPGGVAEVVAAGASPQSAPPSSS